MKLIPLGGKKGKGLFAQVDDEDYALVGHLKWHLSTKGYVVRNQYVDGTKRQRPLYMHWLILGEPHHRAKPGGLEVDHFDRNKLNNQRHNISACTRSDNHKNKNKYISSTGRYKCVSFQKAMKKYVARLTVEGGKRQVLGYFTTEDEAAAAWIAAAKATGNKYYNV